MESSILNRQRLEGYEIILASQPEDFEAAGKLFREYAASLEIDLCFQNFEDELQNLRVHYDLPTGALVLVSKDAEYVGCAGIRRIDTRIGELKRMYVKPADRGTGIGRILLEQATDAARKLRYEYLRLDTLQSMARALKLYRQSGFYDIPPYYPNPEKDVLYLEKKLL
jgi:ribosomal protein S18 acetylase RimI-like enzyme